MHINPKHFALFGNFGTGNLGNEASLNAMIDFLRRERPEAQLTCICYGVKKAQEEHNVATIPIKPPLPLDPWFTILDRLLLKIPYHVYDIVHTLRFVQQFNLFIVPGTGIFDDFSERWQAMPYNLFKWSLAAKLMRRPFIFISVGAGPIRHPVSRWLLKSAARMAHYRSYRDNASKNYMLSLGASAERDPVFPDLAFALPVPQCAPSQTRHGYPLTVGVGVMHYFGWDRSSADGQQIYETYISRMTQFVCWLHENDYRVRLLMGALSDQQCIDDVLGRVVVKFGKQAAEAIIAEPAFSFQDLMKQMTDTDLIVATRFHNIISALMLGRPTISIGYAEKNELLLAQVGLGAFCQPADGLDVAVLIAQFKKLVEERGRFPNRIRKTTNEFRERLERQDAYLLEQLL